MKLEHAVAFGERGIRISRFARQEIQLIEAGAWPCSICGGPAQKALARNAVGPPTGFLALCDADFNIQQQRRRRDLMRQQP